jgi:hypothetical protein
LHYFKQVTNNFRVLWQAKHQARYQAQKMTFAELSAQLAEQRRKKTTVGIEEQLQISIACCNGET